MKLFKKALIILPSANGLTGGGIMNKRNIEIVKECSESIVTMRLPPPLATKNVFSLFYNSYAGYVVGINKTFIKQCISILENTPDIDVIFLSSSLYGKIAKSIRILYPSKKIMTFFHNAEYHYAIQAYKTSHFSLGLLSWILFSYLAEKKSVKYSDVCFVLSNRDWDGLNKKYKLPQVVLLPMSILDEGRIDYVLNVSEPLRLLFVGSDFFANIEGLRWFVNEVIPSVHMKLLVAGNGLEKYRTEFQSDRIEVIGCVENLKEIYAMADIVVCPVRTGSGMKTKTAEALMYGRPLLGTSEAFIGYDNCNPAKVGFLCNAAEDFIKNLSHLDSHREKLLGMALSARLIYENHYSLNASMNKIYDALR